MFASFLYHPGLGTHNSSMPEHRLCFAWDTVGVLGAVNNCAPIKNVAHLTGACIHSEQAQSGSMSRNSIDLL